jgi:glycosyltransferase involved in cell wall biosynthesis
VGAKYAHISLFKTRDAAGRHLGGVEQFGMYLKRAIPEMSLFSWPDYPEFGENGHLQDYEKAEMLNTWLLKSGLVDENTIVITDGYWANGLQGKVARLISVVHGSYWGRYMIHQVFKWGDEVIGMNHVNAQFDIWEDDRVEVVCVSQASADELGEFGAGCECEVTVIEHGIDLERFRPLPDASHGLWMHGATSGRKGYDVIVRLAAMGKHYIEPMNERSGVPENKVARLNEAKCLLAPTRHEGNSYLLLEALACGVPLITYYTGLAESMDERVGIVTDNLDPYNFARLMDSFDPSLYDPRGWAEEFASFDRFAIPWRVYLDI